MQPLREIHSQAVLLPRSNIDTDQLLPGRFLKRPRSDGYGQFLFHDLRFDERGEPRGDFPLNQNRQAGRTIIIAGANFGCGSSREGAVYALYDFGIRCVVAPSFGDIFFNNCLKNALVPIRLPEIAMADLFERVSREDAAITVDIEQTVLRSAGSRYPFQLPSFPHMCLLRGKSDLDITLEYRDLIREYQAKHLHEHPWLNVRTVIAHGSNRPTAGQTRVA